MKVVFRESTNNKNHTAQLEQVKLDLEVILQKIEADSAPTATVHLFNKKRNVKK